jgi:hypothetical protein
VLTEHKDVLMRIADELLVREVLDADQVLRLARGVPLQDPPPAAAPATPDESRRENPAERSPIVPALGKPIGQE